MVNTSLFQHSMFQMLNCQALNNVFVFKLQYFRPAEQATEFSAILGQQQNDNTSRLVSRQKEAWNDGNYKQRAIRK